MAVFSVHVYRPIPGRGLEMLGQMSKAKAIMEANGAVCSAWQPIAGGEAGTIAFVDAYDGPGSYGRAMDAVNASPDWQAFVGEILTNPSGTNTDNYTLYDLDATQGLPTVASRVLYQISHRTVPGRLDDHITALATGAGHLARLGAQVRAIRVTGKQSNSLGLLVGFEDFTHYGEFGEKLAVDESFASFSIDIARDPSAIELESGVAAMVDLP